MITKIFLASLVVYASSLAGVDFNVDKNLIDKSSSQNQLEKRMSRPFKISSSLGIDIRGKAATILDHESGQILFEKNSQASFPMASLTKIMTAVVLLDSQISLEDTYTIEPEVLSVYGSDINLETGEEIKVIDLLHGLLIKSGNDAAIAIARKVAKDEAKFVKLMNQKAKDLGLINTKFQNPHGLDQKNHYASAYDLAKLASYAYKKNLFRELILMKEYEFDAINIQKQYQFKNTNKLLQDDYFLINGGKTGFTDEAGYCFISFGVNEKNNEIITVVLGAKDDGLQYHDTKALVEWTFGNHKWE